MSLLLVDTGNLYYCVTKRFPGKRIDYAKFLTADRAIAFVAESNNDVEGFKAYLTELGYEVVSKRPQRKKVKGELIYQTSWAVEMTIAVSEYLRDAGDNNITIGSSDIDLLPLLQWQKCHVYASGIPRVFKPIATCVEIDEDVLV